jgi:hypothetical protein
MERKSLGKSIHERHTESERARERHGERAPHRDALSVML